jgi:hypothetical protein
VTRSVRSRYAHAFSTVAVAPHSEGSWRGEKAAARRRMNMPHPEHRQPARVAPDLADLRVAEVIEKGLKLRIGCDNCHREAVWTPVFMRRRLGGLRGLTVAGLSLRLRCGSCRSEYIRLWEG